MLYAEDCKLIDEVYKNVDLEYIQKDISELQNWA